tara:strand:+ start:1584 stop:2357 length:774 start_codon:yes stop_codon:yes gene_type:complete
MKTAVVFTCAHSDPSVPNDRFDWLGNLLYDIRPDYVVDLGDGADLKSLNGYDTKYPKAIVAQNYEEDINCYNDAQERLRRKFKQMKKKRPAFFGLEGNHENRIKKAIAYDPRLEGSKYGISFSHLQTNTWFDEYHEYNNSAPSIANYDGVSYAHYIASGNYGTALSGIHHGYGLVQKRHCSTTVGHSHKRSLFFKDDAYPNPTIGLVAGCFKGGQEGWAGQSNLEWWKGVIIKRNIQNGYYEPEFVSLERLRDIYGK